MSAMAAFGADRLRVMSATGATSPASRLPPTLAPRREAIEAFADQGGIRLSNQLARLWDELFPLILAAHRGRWSRRRNSQFERRHQFLVHQRAWA